MKALSYILHLVSALLLIDLYIIDTAETCTFVLLVKNISKNDRKKDLRDSQPTACGFDAV